MAEDEKFIEEHNIENYRRQIKVKEMIEMRKNKDMKSKIGGASDYDPLYSIETSYEMAKQVDGDRLWKIPYQDTVATISNSYQRIPRKARATDAS